MDKSRDTFVDLFIGHAHLALAKRNLETAKCLFSNKFYPQAIFYLEQAVEEATKFMGVYFGICDENELRFHIKHQPAKIFKKILNHLRKIQKPIIESYKSIQIAKQPSLSKFDAIINNYEFYIDNPNKFISEQDLGKIIATLVNFKEKISDPKVMTKIKNLGTNKQIIREIVNSLPKSGLFKSLEKMPPGSIEKFLKKLESLPQEIIRDLFSPSLIIGLFWAPLVNLCIILSPHATYSRYFYSPEHNPLNVYTEGHLLIKKFNQLADFTDVVLEQLETEMANWDFIIRSYLGAKPRRPKPL